MRQFVLTTRNFQVRGSEASVRVQQRGAAGRHVRCRLHRGRFLRHCVASSRHHRLETEPGQERQLHGYRQEPRLGR